MFQPTPKSTLNVSNLSFHPAAHALLASAIGRPIVELAEERSSAAPLSSSQAGSVPGMVNLNFSSIKGGSGAFHTLMGSRFFALAHVYGHITLNTPVLVRSLKLSKVETC